MGSESGDGDFSGKLSSRATFSPEQLTRYFDRISLPQHYRRLDGYVGRSHHGLRFLTALQKYHMAAVPFETLSLHYSPSHTVSLDPEHLFHKIVERNMGGTSMETNCFFATVLRTLAYELYTAGARVNIAAMPGGPSQGKEGPRFSGWCHMVNIVKLNGQRYITDVGFGSNASIQPMRLVDGTISPSIPPQSVRLIYANIPQNTNPDQKLWRYQHRSKDTKPWLDGYCFSEVEFLPEDYTIMSYSTSTGRTSWHTQKVICVKMIMDGEDVVGKLILLEDELTWVMRDQPRHVEKLESEAKRIEALHTHFGIHLHPDEKGGILGTMTAIHTQGSRA